MRSLWPGVVDAASELQFLLRGDTGHKTVKESYILNWCYAFGTLVICQQSLEASVTRNTFLM